ncbi:MAG: peptidoglycan editing factor PgeF [Gallionellaceae bacterium]|nr:peptidoglycan editing factor PgeF [Gallionellaceae bacterium]
MGEVGQGGGYLIPDWPAPKNIRCLQSTRLGGVSTAPYESFNLGDHVGDEPQAVAKNRQLLSSLMPSEPVWLQQVHGTVIANADVGSCLIHADASIARHRGSVCVVMTADCLPILLCDEDGTVVGAAHAGWKGLAAGVIEATVNAMNVAPKKLMAWFGPAISQRAFEVGEEVRATFIAHNAQASEAFIPSPPRGEGQGRGDEKKYHADIYLLAHQRLNALGITRVYGGEHCTYTDSARFFSYRRDGVTGRMGTFIWLE